MPTPTRADGMGSVVLDVVPAHVRVDDVYDTNPHKVQVVTDIKIEKGHPYDTIITTYETQEVTDRQLVPLCEAPCALTLPTGTHHLHLQSIDDGRWSMLDVDVTAAPQTIRVGLGHTASKNDWVVRFIAGAVLLAPGLSLLTVGGADWGALSGEPTSADHDRVQGDAVGLTIAGTVLLAAGITAFVLTRPPSQDTVVRVDQAKGL
jgi:hypothetical protein